jgi:hypothetical protein
MLGVAAMRAAFALPDLIGPLADAALLLPIHGLCPPVVVSRKTGLS